MLEVSEIGGLAGLDELREEWDDLLSRSRNAGIFQTWEWISSCRRSFGHGKRLATVTVRDQGRLVGLAPLEIASMYGLPLRRLQFIGTGVSDYLDFVLDGVLEDAVLEVISAWLRDNQGRWDLLDLQQIPEGSPTLRLWENAEWDGEAGQQDSNVQHSTSNVQPPARDGWHSDLLKQEICPYLSLAASWDDMQARFGKKMRWNLGYYERLINRNFEAGLGALTEPELEEGMDAFFRLHTLRWRRRWLPGMLVGARKQRFHREVARLAAERGWLRLHGLRLDGRLQSVLYCFAHRGKGYYYLGGFEPTLSKYSLGTVLTGFAIRDAIESGCREFDFLRGDEPYKARWTDGHRTNSRLLVHNGTLRSRIAASICRLEQRIERRVKHELHKRFGSG